MQLSPEQQALFEEQKKHCIFCRIIKGEIPSQKVFEDNDFIAILDVNPGAKGHTLLVPKEHAPIMPLLPAEVQARLAKLLPEMSEKLRTALVAPRVEGFIANGPAAGQQSTHFLIHLIPAEEPMFHIPAGQSELNAQLGIILRQRFGSNKQETLTKVIGENAELRRMIIDNPDELIRNLPAAPDLQRLFEGVDIKALSQKLAEAEAPHAEKLTDEQLVQFINSKEKLRDLLISDPTTLEEAAASQPRLKKFFEGTTVAAVRERYLRGAGDV